MFRDDVSRLQREHDDAYQQAVLDESRRLEGLIAKHRASIKENHHLEIECARHQRDVEISILKEQHEAKQDKLQQKS